MEEGGSSNYSKVKAYISVSNNHPTRYYCGDTVSGLVVIDAETVFTTRAICVVLVGMEFAQQHKTFQRRNFYTQRLILFGEDWPKRNNGAVIQLPPGKHTFPFTFQLPPARPAPGEKRVVLPPTGGGLIWYDRRHNNRSVVAVSYIIRSFVDLNHSPALRVLHSIEPSLFSPDTIVTPLWSIPMRGHTETYEFIKNGLRTGISHEESKTFLAASGSLSCKVILDRNVTFTYDDDRHGLPADLQAQIHAGEPFCRPLKALVTVVNNSSLPVEAISISLAQEGLVSITGNPHCGDTWQNDSYLYPHAKVDIPAVKTGGPAVAYEHLFTMKVPDNLTPHIETFYSKLRWFVKVEVHVGSALALNLIVKVPIHIVSLGPEPLLREILSEPFEPIVLPGSFAPTQTILVPTRKGADIYAEELATFGVLPKEERTCTCCVRSNTPTPSTSATPTPVVIHPPTKADSVPATPELEVLNPIPTEQLLAKALKWMPDNEVTTCLKCNAHFGVFVRRHHCRLCGKVFCSSCAPVTDIPAVFGTVPQRACTSCHSGAVTQAVPGQHVTAVEYNPKNVK
eukprot:TRINITY_DN1009_c0_g1_i2.p1 TRINITY_DN1009_c0_g1~~TRINITY_DN1009_c0_g1_i2.p1  ORF type:complete len:634 (-),score=84.88 TRINITY_DN1009_c0_g1_i2:68-1768(-)